jgi:hypothetical protein
VGRRTQLGYVGVIGFYLARWLFGWIETVWCIIMLPLMVLLLRAERRAATVLAAVSEFLRRPLNGPVRDWYRTGVHGPPEHVRAGGLLEDEYLGHAQDQQNQCDQVQSYHHDGLLRLKRTAAPFFLQ